MSDDALGVMAEEQAALRRVATLVARGAPRDEIFAELTNEVGRLFRVDVTNLCRYEYDGTYTILASAGARFPVGSRWTLGGHNGTTQVFETGRPARIDDYATATGQGGVRSREEGVRSSVGTPIVVEGRLWGVIGVATSLEQPLPMDTETRLASFTELAATAIANAESRAALAASRARIAAAADETRRQIHRNLHDGAQQQLVNLMLELRLAEATGLSEVSELKMLLARTADGLGDVLEELREMSQGLHPGVLAKGGLAPALRALADRSALHVELDVHTEGRLPEHVEVAAYYVVSEALTNAAKHARASIVHVELDVRESMLRLAIADDGIGGAEPARGSGLIGLSDRVEALGGTLELASGAGHGTALLVLLPLRDTAQPRSRGASRETHRR